MAHHLVLFLGTGALRPAPADAGPVADAREGAYRLTRYAFAGADGQFVSGPVETPFVGEAILDLAPDRFSHVHIFGTADSMWDALAESTGDAGVELAVEIMGSDNQWNGPVR
ncbi:MAG: hypothetical protein AAGI91_15340 [Bacteroidota bacterium]